MKKTKLLEPYTKDGKTTFSQRNKPGVYLIYKNGELRYIGMSENNLYRTMYRHFQNWDKSKQERVQYKYLAGIKCRVIYCTAAQAIKLEKALIVKLKPTDNPNKYDEYILEFKDEKIIQEVKQADEVPF
jgi:hypothetical protein